MDRFVALAPLALLAIVVLFAFVGCGLRGSGELKGLTVALSWTLDLGSDIAKIIIRVDVTSKSFTGFKERESEFPAALHDATLAEPSVLPIRFDEQPPEPISCSVFCRLLDAGGTVRFFAQTPNPKEDVVGGDGRTWLFALQPTVDLNGQIVAFEINFVAEEA